MMDKMVDRSAQEKIGNIVMSGSTHDDQVAVQLCCGIGNDLRRLPVINGQIAAFGICSVIASQSGLDFLDVHFLFRAADKQYGAIRSPEIGEQFGAGERSVCSGC